MHHIVVIPMAQTGLINTANVTANQFDLAPTNNVATFTIDIDISPALGRRIYLPVVLKQ